MIRLNVALLATTAAVAFSSSAGALPMGCAAFSAGGPIIV